MMTAVMEEKDVYLSSFARLETQWKNSDPPWLARLRQAAIDRFAALGFPTLDEEEWRFTPLKPLTQVPFETASPRQDQQGPCWHLPGALPAGVILCSLAEALAHHAPLLEAHLAQYADFEDQPFTALNTAFLQEGVFLYLPSNCVIEQPIELRAVGREAGPPTVWHRRCLIVAEANSHARLTERYQGQAGVYFTNAVTEVVLGDHAVIDYYKLQQESREAFHVHTLQVQQGRGSNFASHAVTLGGRLTRNDINTVLAGEGCTCTLNGLYMGNDEQLIDNHTRIEHAQPHCASHELYKGILDGHARGVFNGKIHVHPAAQKTDAKQTNQTLLLSQDAIINTKPQLEIYADDVKCTHGATVGQLDAEGLFYLRSRGLGKKQARSLLIYAFANDLVSRIKMALLRCELEKLLLQTQHLPPSEEIEELP